MEVYFTDYFAIPYITKFTRENILSESLRPFGSLINQFQNINLLFSDLSKVTINFECFSFTEDKNYTVLTKDVLKFLDDVHDTLMRDVLEEGSKRANKVVNFRHPKDLKVTHSSSFLFESA